MVSLILLSTPVNWVYRCQLRDTSKHVLIVSMSKASRKFHVPDPLAHVYDFANTLDLRHFIQNGVRHPTDDELQSPADLSAWLDKRGLIEGGARLTLSLFHEALRFRASLRDYLGC